MLAVPPPAPTLRLIRYAAGNILLVDATRWAQIGGSGDDWHFHLAYNFSVGRLAEVIVIVTDTHGGEHLGYYRIQPHDIIVADGGYGDRASVATVRKHQAHLITRIRPQTFPFELHDGQILDSVAQLRFCGPNVREWAGWCTTADGERYAVRLLAAKLPAHEARNAQARARRNAQKDGRTIQPQTLLVAGWVLLITTLPAGRWPTEAVLRVYRVRWQVELVFKRLKSGLTRGVLRGQTRASLEAEHPCAADRLGAANHRSCPPAGTAQRARARQWMGAEQLGADHAQCGCAAPAGSRGMGQPAGACVSVPPPALFDQPGTA